MNISPDVVRPLGSQHEIKRFTTDTGMTIVTCHDPGAPIVTLQTWYGVGSRHESPGQTGMAHLFEHLMFNRTERLATGEFDLVLERSGGDSNAATWVDWTYYRDSVPSSEFDRVCDIEADRMTNLVLDETVLESERDVVANERLQRVDDDLDGFIDEELFRHAFTKHPYHWPTIGWMKDIKAIDLASVRAFYRTFYAPNNATLVVVGDVETDRALESIERHFGAIPSSSLPRETVVEEPEQDDERRVQFRRPTSSSRLSIGHKAPGLADPDWPILWFSTALLAGANSSRLHRRLVIDDELASSVDCDVMPFAQPSLAVTSVTATRDADVSAIEAAIEQEIGRLAGGQIDEREIEKLRNVVETEFWQGLATGDGIAETLGHYQVAAGDFQRLFSTTGALEAITPDDVARVVTTYLQAPSTRIVVEPGDKA